MRGLLDLVGKAVTAALVKAFAAGLVPAAGMIPCNLDFILTAAVVRIVYTVFCITFQANHIQTSLIVVS
jgi:hypothetical protein